jgi:hypothetical protein
MREREGRHTEKWVKLVQNVRPAWKANALPIDHCCNIMLYEEFNSEKLFLQIYYWFTMV